MQADRTGTERTRSSGRLAASPRLDHQRNLDDRDLAPFNAAGIQDRDPPRRRGWRSLRRWRADKGFAHGLSRARRRPPPRRRMRARALTPSPAIDSPAVSGQKSLPSSDIFHAPDSAFAGGEGPTVRADRARHPARGGEKAAVSVCPRLSIVSKTRRKQFRGLPSCMKRFPGNSLVSRRAGNEIRRNVRPRTCVLRDKSRGFDSLRAVARDKAPAFDRAQDVLRDTRRG